MSVTIELVYEKLVQLTDLCDMKFKEIDHRLERIEAKLDRLNNRLLSLEAEVGLHDKRIS
jgi:hypothetical protein